MGFVYTTNCVAHNANNVHLLDAMIDESQQITYKTFRKHCNDDALREFDSQGVRLAKDYAVSFYKSRYEGKPCYYMVHSAIEHIWLPA